MNPKTVTQIRVLITAAHTKRQVNENAWSVSVIFVIITRITFGNGARYAGVRN